MSRRSGYRKNISKAQLVLIWVVAILLLGGTLYLVSTKNRSILSSASNQLFGFTSNIINAPFRWVTSGGNYAGSFFSNAETMRKLKEENQALLEWRDEAKALAMRLQQYEELNSIKGEQVTYSKSGRMVAEINGPFSQTGIVNIGTNDGISTDWIAINQNGMVGRVISTSKTSARILLLSDTQSRIPVMGEETRGRAMLIGDKTSAPILAPLNTPNILKNGERIITSGDDGIVPRGLTIGYAGVAPDKKWRVRLNTNKETIDFVKLIKPTNIIAPIDKVTNPNFAPPLAAAVTNSVAANPEQSASQILQTNDGSAALPSENTPSAIAQAQQIRKLKEERDKAIEAAKRITQQEKTKVEKTASDTEPKPKTVDLTKSSDTKTSDTKSQVTNPQNTPQEKSTTHNPTE